MDKTILIIIFHYLGIKHNEDKVFRQSL